MRHGKRASMFLPVPEKAGIRYLLFAIFAFLLLLNMVQISFAAGGSAVNSNNAVADLGMTFMKIIKCAGYITFILGYADFAAALQNGDASSLLLPGKKMFAGIILSQSNWFLQSVGAWDAIKSGTAVSGINSAVTTLCTITSSVIVGIGVVSLISGVQKFFSSFDAHDASSMISSLKSLFAGLLVAIGGGAATVFDVTLGIDTNSNIKNIVNRAQSRVIDIASIMAVSVGVVFLVQGVQSYFAGRDSNDVPGAVHSYMKIFLGVGMAAAGGIAYYLLK
ncbi:MAG: hypothetical protein HFH73_02640 [Lachnospiraceae bacterium]|nr:hypothetical protein [Lachnospiraceae bacterium]